MYFCESCGATKGALNVGCPAFYSRGPHVYVVGNVEMTCTYCEGHPGGPGTRCPGRTLGGSHDFQSAATTPGPGHMEGKTKLLTAH